MTGFGVSLGFATWTMGDVGYANYFPELSAAGFDGVDILGDRARFDPIEVRSIAYDHGLSIFSVTAPYDLDLAHPLRSLRQKSVDEARALIDYCAECGADRLVLREKPGRIRPIVGRRREWNLLKQSLRSVADHAAGLPLMVSLLPVNRYEGFLVNSVRDGLQTLDEIASPNIDLALNTYHMNIEESDLIEALDEGAERLGLLYLAENHRRALGSGHIDWIEVCQLLNRVDFHGLLLVECQADGADPFLALGRHPEWSESVIEWAADSMDHLKVALAAAY